MINSNGCSNKREKELKLDQWISFSGDEAWTSDSRKQYAGEKGFSCRLDLMIAQVT